MALSTEKTPDLPTDKSAGFGPASHGRIVALCTENSPHILIRKPATVTSISPGSASPVPEAEKRLECAKRLEKYIQPYEPAFRLYCEYVATIMMVDMRDLSKGGALWADPSNLTPSDTMEGFLQAVSPLCRHCKGKSNYRLLWPCK